MRFARTLGPVARALSARSLRTSSVLRPLPYKGAASPLNVRRADARNFERAGCAIGTRAYATEASETKREGGEKSEERSSFFNSTGWETAMGASAGVLLLGFAAMGYQQWYKAHVLRKMEAAFDPGYDPVLELVKSSDQLAHVSVTPPRREEALIDAIVGGREAGHYFLILGSKGAGKATMIIDAMSKYGADGCAFFDAHEDPSIVVDRFSESINYSMNRDYLGNLLGLSDLSGMSSYQNVERALHKLEKALIRRRARTGRPAVIVMNNAHLLPRDEEGNKLLHLFQQRAEKWASAGVATFVFTSADYWVYDVLRKASNRMDTLTVKDLSRAQAYNVLRSCRKEYYGEAAAAELSNDILDQVYQIVGGRISLLNRMARRQDMIRAANQLVEDDLQWLQSKTGIIEDHDDDVMDEQKWSTCSWLLFVELAKRQAALEEEVAESGPPRKSEQHVQHHTSSAEDSASASASASESASAKVELAATDPSLDELVDVDGQDVCNPHLTWGEARQVMTRPDFITELDHLNIIFIDRHHHIRADSMPLLRAFRRLAETEGYEDKLERVMDRVSSIESLGRTRELVWKEQGDAGKFLIKHDAKGREIESWMLLGGDERLGRDTGEEGDEG